MRRSGLTLQSSGQGASRSGKRRCYSLRVVRSVERESGFAKRPNTMLNLARFARWTPNRYALGCRLA